MTKSTSKRVLLKRVMTECGSVQFSFSPLAKARQRTRENAVSAVRPVPIIAPFFFGR